jgi:hypothetical protein
MAGEMLRGFAGGATVKEGEIEFGGLGVEEFFGMGVEPGAVAAKSVEKEKFGGECIGGDAGLAENMDALFEGSANVEGVGLLGVHRFTPEKRA